ncbi:MAG TPA: type VI secretion system baseplate subunit TssE [Blastocatellia bacterium]|nr:type VI secretion system baseplate subunit TssE [Blastocatellia bacterium]
MREPKPIVGARALLFDRLVDLHPEIREEERPFRILNRDQLKVSIRRELERLLNTRCSLSLERVGEEDRSVVNYGIPDFSSLSPSNADDHALIASIIRQTIAAFEPRLRQVYVEVTSLGAGEASVPVQTKCAHDVFEIWESRPSGEGTLRVSIDAVMTVGEFNEPVHFPVVLNSMSGAVEIHDSQ